MRDQAGPDLAAGNHPGGQVRDVGRATVPGAGVDRPDELAAEQLARLVIHFVGDLLADFDEGGAVRGHFGGGGHVEGDGLEDRQIFQPLGATHGGLPR